MGSGTTSEIRLDIMLKNITSVRPCVPGAIAKKGMHAFFFFADCYHEAGRCRLTG